VEQAGAQTGHPVVEIERVAGDDAQTGLEAALPRRPTRSSSSVWTCFGKMQAPPKWRLFAGFSRTWTILSLSVPITTSVTCPIYHMTSGWIGKWRTSCTTETS
jgi:hypothetical protein